MKSIKEQADEVVDKFRKELFNGKIYTAQFNNPHLKADTGRCIQCAIIYCDGILKELIRGEGVSFISPRKNVYKGILTELKSRI